MRCTPNPEYLSYAIFWYIFPCARPSKVYQILYKLFYKFVKNFTNYYANFPDKTEVLENTEKRI